MGNYVSNNYTNRRLAKEKAAQEEAIRKQIEYESIKELLTVFFILILSFMAVGFGVFLVIGL